MPRVGRPPIGGAARQLIAIRVDPDVLERFRKEARRRKVGYQTLINEVLTEHAGRMSHDPTRDSTRVGSDATAVTSRPFPRRLTTGEWTDP
jgi:hypothetical protein